MERNNKEELFKEMVMTGFTPLKNFIEYKHLEDEITDEDIALVVKMLGQNLANYSEYLRRRSRQSYENNNLL